MLERPIPFNTLPKDSDFIAIDFETANREPASACALGLAFVKDGKIIANPSWLIRPPRLYFDPAFIPIHGITEEHIIDKPEFSELWHELWPYLASRLIIAHNAEFDIKVLSGMLKHYSIALPSLSYGCTKIISQHTWPSWQKYNLAALAERHGISFQHHNAGEDAYVCARVALLACQEKSQASLDSLFENLELDYGRLNKAGHFPMKVKRLMPQPLNFGGWPAGIHYQAEQVKRQERAAEIKDATIDVIAEAGEINDYHVTLNSCTCQDFAGRRLPCKHIYHLALKLATK